jgi:uncharacterized protein
MQVLLTRPPLSAYEIFIVACIPAFSEEMVFRGALVGLIGPSPLSVLSVALLFGTLHVSGGRNFSSGVFATYAGLLYGVIYVVTGSVWAAVLSHCVGNVTSAASWLLEQPPGWVAGESMDEGDGGPVLW